MTDGSPLPRIDGHVLERELGRGAMGCVYAGRDLALQRPVAVKVLLAPDFASAETLARFRHESEAVARLKHPHIVQVYASGTTDGAPWFSMELVDGAQPLGQGGVGPGGGEREAALVGKLARALHHAHEQGIVHRDLKPANVLVDAAGEPHVTDFGVAKWWRPGLASASKRLTVKGTLLGTAGYMSPEQARGETEAVGPPTDVWALGVVLYELLTGRVPFAGATETQTLGLILREEPPSPAWARPGLSRALEAVCLRCLRKAPAERYPSAAALADDLEAVVRGEPPPGLGPARRRGWLARLFRR